MDPAISHISTCVSTAAKQNAFLQAYRVCGTIRRAAIAAEIDRTTHYEWLKQDEYAAAFAQAQEDATDYLEDEARRRAAEGTRVLKFTKDGSPIPNPFWKEGDPESEKYYVEHVYSDKLMDLLLRGNRPRKFANRHEVTGADGGPLDVNHSLGGLVVGDQELSNDLCDALEEAVQTQRERSGDSKS